MREPPRDATIFEIERLEAVRRYDILDTPPDGAFDRITTIVAQELRVPIAIVSIVDHDRIWFKSRHGIEVDEIGRDPGLCASCIMQDVPWVVNDARNDPRTLANPLVAGTFGLQFYLGVPLRTADGFNLGTLCAIDLAPRTPSKRDVALLQNLAGVVIDELELRLSARRALGRYHEELARRERREDHIRGLMRVLAHRAKNLLAVVQSIARQTAPNSTSVDDYVTGLEARVHGLALTHDLIAEDDWRGVAMRDLAVRQVEPFVASPVLVRYDGPPVSLAPAAAQNIGLALHELATNAATHGALSEAGGDVELAWWLDQSRLFLVWRERTKLPIVEPQRMGFGRLVLERITPEALGGDAALAFDATGISWSLNVPSTHLL